MALSKFETPSMNEWANIALIAGHLRLTHGLQSLPEFEDGKELQDPVIIFATKVLEVLFRKISNYSFEKWVELFASEDGPARMLPGALTFLFHERTTPHPMIEVYAQMLLQSFGEDLRSTLTWERVVRASQSTATFWDIVNAVDEADARALFGSFIEMSIDFEGHQSAPHSFELLRRKDGPLRVAINPKNDIAAQFFFFGQSTPERITSITAGSVKVDATVRFLGIIDPLLVAPQYYIRKIEVKFDEEQRRLLRKIWSNTISLMAEV